MRDVALYYHDGMLAHRNRPGPHPERPERLAAIRELLLAEPVPHTRWVEATPAERRVVERLHPAAYLDWLETLRGRTVALDPDTGLAPQSWEAAWLSAGAAVQATVDVVAGHTRSGFSLGRPPGHHAERARPMGFCLLGNVAIAAAHAVEELGLERVLVVDWDVHHGNGTQRLFYEDPRVLFFSTHQYPFYPGTGAASEVGFGPGRGFTVNVPLPPGRDNGDLAAAFDQLLIPIADAFRPQLVLVSAGYDAHQCDPLGHMVLTDDGFAALTGIVAAIARRHAAGRLAFVLEGGYDLPALAASVRATVAVAAGERPPLVPEPSETGQRVIDKVRQIQRGFWPLG